MSKDQVVQVINDSATGDGLWSPVVGQSLSNLLRGSELSTSVQDSVAERAVSILSACLPPQAGAARTRTGLVLGYVQSGKTASFTAVTALARDNHIPLVILLSGTKTNLHRQTSDRLKADLARPGGASTDWLLIDNLAPDDSNFSRVETLLRASSKSAGIETVGRTVVITVMKNKTRLGNLAGALRKMKRSGALDPSVPLLIIDDEADQAGLNAGDAEKQSATYASIVDLRDAAGTHSYIMYTATPQAPLLLELSDLLSPNFVRVLEPGADYTGGSYFFDQAAGDFVREIPQEEVEAFSTGEMDEPPASMEHALAVFLLGVVAEGAGVPRSMLIHPSHDKSVHAEFARWASSRAKGFATLIRAGGADLDELIADTFQEAWRDLRSTVPDLQPLTDLLPRVALLVETELSIRTVNSEDGEEGEIEWSQSSAWILVGGYKLDRGFTVEGLTVTYMPRSVGVGNADSIQQRARFFGYKRAYAHLCRAWLDQRLSRAFTRYVDHERHLMAEMSRVEREGERLDNWKRRMLLDPSLKPCRRAVISLDYVHSALRGDGWVKLSRIAGGRCVPNADLLNRFAESLALTEDPEDQRAERKHLRGTVLASHAIAELLVPWTADGTDAARLSQVSVALGHWVDENPDTRVEVVLMDSGVERGRAFSRVDPLRVVNLHAGRSRNYGGDSVVHSDSLVTIQLHKVRDSNDDSRRGFAAITIWIPKEFETGVLVEPY